MDAKSNLCDHFLSGCLLLLQCRFPSTETIRTNRDGESRKSTSTFTQLLNSDGAVLLKVCFMSTETIRANRDEEPRTSTSAFTQLLSFNGAVLLLKV